MMATCTGFFAAVISIAGSASSHCIACDVWRGPIIPPTPVCKRNRHAVLFLAFPPSQDAITGNHQMCRDGARLRKVHAFAGSGQRVQVLSPRFSSPAAAATNRPHRAGRHIDRPHANTPVLEARDTGTRPTPQRMPRRRFQWLGDCWLAAQCRSNQPLRKFPTNQERHPKPSPISVDVACQRSYASLARLLETDNSNDTTVATFLNHVLLENRELLD